MRYVFVAILACILLAGCFGTTPEQQEDMIEEEPTNVSETNETEGEDEPVAGGDGTIIEAPEPEDEEEPPPYTGPSATSQEECATMTPDCGSCVSKPGCGWCKSSNSCFIGTASGPSVRDRKSVV